MTHIYKYQFPTEYNMRPQETFSWNEDGLLTLILACTLVTVAVTIFATWH